MDSFNKAVDLESSKLNNKKFIFRSQVDLTPTRSNPYVSVVAEEQQWIFNLGRAAKQKGQWRETVLNIPLQGIVDLEIGTGNGFFFQHRANQFPDRKLLGIEIKYKPLVQTLWRTLKAGSENIRLIRYDAQLISDLFAPQELNDVFIFFPDPWEKRKAYKHRLIQDDFLKTLFEIQRPGSFLEFKTDSQDYFNWTLSKIKNSSYELLGFTDELHKSKWAENNFQTHFEKLWVKKGRKIFYLHALRANR